MPGGWLERAFGTYGNAPLKAELGLTILGSAAVSWAVMRAGTLWLPADRCPLYGALASFHGTMLGFLMTALALVIGLTGSGRMVHLRGSAALRVVLTCFVWGICGHAGGTALALAGLVVDTSPVSPPWLCGATAIALLFSALMLARCLWVLVHVLGLATSGPQSSA